MVHGTCWASGRDGVGKRTMKWHDMQRKMAAYVWPIDGMVTSNVLKNWHWKAAKGYCYLCNKRSRQQARQWACNGWAATAVCGKMSIINGIHVDGTWYFSIQHRHGGDYSFSVCDIMVWQENIDSNDENNGQPVTATNGGVLTLSVVARLWRGSNSGDNDDL